jgi:ferredoxin
MTDGVYERLAAALDRLPNGFPRTASGVELRILARIYTPEEAALAAELTRDMEAVEEIAARCGLEPRAARKLLIQMTRRGQVWIERGDGTLRARLAPFIVGVYEAQAEVMDHDLAHLVEHYLSEGGVKGIMGPEPALHRVVPAHAALGAETIMPYDDVRAILLAAKSFHVSDCICRKEQDLVGTRRCAFPLDVCLSFSAHERPLGPGDLTQEEALALLARTEQVGLVHTVSNVRQGMGYVCNCCGCCCGLLRGITEFGIEHSVARANYLAVVDEAACIGCGLCVERCQVGAVILAGGLAVVDVARCIGCGLCVTGCPDRVAHLVPRGDAETRLPPADYRAWEDERLHNRGMGQ